MQTLMTATTAFLLVTSVFFMLRTRLYAYRHPIACLRVALHPRAGARERGQVSPLGGMLLALAGTLGVGNIAGVATALWAGGPGAIFWMVISGLLVAVLKYAEIVLALRHRRMTPDGPCGGAPYYISDLLSQRGHPMLGRLLAGLFALLCILNALTMGSILQINAAASAMEGAFDLPPLVTGLAAAGLCGLVLSGGATRIAALTERLVPLMTIGFLILCTAVLILRRERLPDALSAILTGAFTTESMGAGVTGLLVSRAMRTGVMRGLISNEAGCGTAPLAHATAETNSPAAQGILGMVEVVVDTVMLCSLTALTILVSDTGYTAFGADGAACAHSAFTSVLGDWAGCAYALAMLLFALGSGFCWAHYGRTCVSYLAGHRRHGPWQVLFAVAFCSALVCGAVTAPHMAWSLADAAIACMALLNLLFLWVGDREILEETQVLTRHIRAAQRTECNVYGKLPK